MNDDQHDATWNRIEQRLRQSAMALKGSAAQDERHRAVVYHQRSIRLAARATPDEALRPRTQTLVFALGDQRYGIPLGNVAQVFPPLRWTPVPLAPAWLLGVANFDSHVRSVLDLRPLLGMPTERIDATGNMLLLRTQRGLVGARVDRVLEIQKIDFSKLTAPDHGSGNTAAHAVRGATPERLMILCADALLAQTVSPQGSV